MEIDALRPSTENLIVINTSRVRQTTEQNELPPAPASALAVPSETARNEINQAAALPGLMAPTRDGIFAIGPTAVKIGSTIKVGASRSFNSWGF